MIIVLYMFSSCLPPFFPYRSTVLFPPAGWEKRNKREEQDRQALPALFPSGLRGERESGAGDLLPFRGAGRPSRRWETRGAAGTRRRGSSVSAPTGAACDPAAAPQGSGVTLRRRMGSGGLRGSWLLRGRGSRGTEGWRDGWMKDGGMERWRGEWWRDGRTRDAGMRMEGERMEERKKEDRGTNGWRADGRRAAKASARASQLLPLRCAPPLRSPPSPPPPRVPAPGADSPSHPPPAAAAPGMGSESAPRSSPGPAVPPCSRHRCCSYPAAAPAPPPPAPRGQRRRRATRSLRLGRVSSRALPPPPQKAPAVHPPLPFPPPSHPGAAPGMSAGEDKGLRGETPRSCPPPGERRVPARACAFPLGGRNVRGAAGMSPGFRGGCGEGGFSLLALPGTAAHSHGGLSHAQTDTPTAPLPNRRQEPLEPPQTPTSPRWLGGGGSTLTFARDHLKVGWNQLSRVGGFPSVAPRKGSGGGSRSPSPGPPRSPGAAELSPSLGAAEGDGGVASGRTQLLNGLSWQPPPAILN